MCQAVPTLPTGCGAGGSRAEICRDPACSMSSAASFVWGFYFPACLFVFSLPALILSWLRAGAGGRGLRGEGSHLGMGMRAVGHPKALWGHKRWLLGHRLLLHGVCSPHPTPTTPFNAGHFASLQLEPCPAGIRAFPPGLGTRDPSHGATGHPAPGSAPRYRARSIAELQPRGTSGLGGGHPKGPQDPQPPRHGAGEGTSTPFGTGERDRAVPQPRCLHSWHPGAAPRCYSNTKPWDAMPFKRGTARLGLNY